MKRSLSMLLAGVMLVGTLAGCGGNSTQSGSETSGTEENTATGTAFKIGGTAPLTGDAAIYGNAVARGAQIAADEIGNVSATPTSTDTAIPIRNGCKFVAHMMSAPTCMAAAPSAGAHHAASATPTPIVTSGVTKMSMRVSPATALPTSAARMATNRTASGPPAPPSALDAKPTVISENSTSGGHWSA